MLIWLKEILMQGLIWLLGFIDSIFVVFRSVAGLDSVTTENGEQTLSSYFLNLNGVQWAFWVIFIASIGICAVCTVVAVVKNAINARSGETKSHVRTLGQSMSTLLVSLFMAMLLIVGVACADGLLSAIDKGINHGEQTFMSHEIINISVGDGFLYDVNDVQGLNERDEDGNYTFVSYLYRFEVEDPTSGQLLPKRYDDGTGRIIFLDDKGNRLRPEDTYTEIEDENGNKTWKITEKNLEKLTPLRTYNGWRPKDIFGAMNGDTDGDVYYSKNDLRDNFWDEDVEHILGDDKWMVVPLPYGWKNDGLVDPEAFNFLVAYICAVVLMIALISATFGLVKRLFDIVLLFIALPGIAATIPLDDGAKFKLWRETVISKVFLAFGTVLAVNVFTIVAPSLWGVSLGTSENSFANSILRLVLICGGALTISGGQLLFARLLGTSAEESREMAQSARTLMGGAMTAWGGAKAAGRLAFGYRNANGQRMGGLLKGSANALGALGGGTVNAAGSIIGGQAYRSSRFASGVAATQRALKGFGGSAGWIGKDRVTGENTLGGSIGSGMGKFGNKLSGSIGAQKTGLDKGLLGGVHKLEQSVRSKASMEYGTQLDKENHAKQRAGDIAAAFGVSPYAVKHVKNKKSKE